VPWTGRNLEGPLTRAGQLQATLVGQDLDEGVDGVFRIARRVAKDRVISIVDPGARHGHKTSARGFDGYKGHVAIDPDSEVITATAVTAGNTGDAASASDLLAQDLPDAAADPADSQGPMEPPLAVYGDAAYGSGGLLADLEAAGADIMTKVQPPVAPGGRFAKDRFVIDTGAGTVTCPADVSVAIQPAKAGGDMASFGTAGADCRLAAQCTTAASGRRIRIGPHEAELVRARATQQDPAWWAAYRATRPKVERKIGHLMRRRHAGRRARVRGQTKVAADLLITRCRNEAGPVRRARTHPGGRARVGSGPKLTHQGSPPG
jgi:Transposase DDE domain